MIISSSCSACFGCVYTQERLNGPHCLIHNRCVQYATSPCEHIKDTVRDCSLLYAEHYEDHQVTRYEGWVKQHLKSSSTIMREQQEKERKAKAAAERREKRIAERLAKEKEMFGSLFD